MPFYVSPEQAMKDKADYARKNIARGRDGVVIQYADGILFVAPNPSRALHKISEIYDRIAFAAVGRYNEYEILRKAGLVTPRRHRRRAPVRPGALVTPERPNQVWAVDHKGWVRLGDGSRCEPLTLADVRGDD